MWPMPSLEEQWAHLREINAIPGEHDTYPHRVRFLTSNFEWEVDGFYKLGDEGRTVFVRLKSPKSGRRRTAWPWELRAVA